MNIIFSIVHHFVEQKLKEKLASVFDSYNKHQSPWYICQIWKTSMGSFPESEFYLL